jgi:hypothetical protein
MSAQNQGSNASENKDLEKARKSAAAKAAKRKEQLADKQRRKRGELTDKDKDKAAQKAQLVQVAEKKAEMTETITRVPKLLAVAGYDGTPGGAGRLKIIEMLNDRTRKWEFLKPMMCKRYMFGAVVLNFPPIKEDLEEDPEDMSMLSVPKTTVVNDESEAEYSEEEDISSEEEEEPPHPCLVVVGGQRNKAVYAEHFNPDLNRWNAVPLRPPKMRGLQRFGCVCVNWNGVMAVVGGQKDEHTPVGIVECYDPFLVEDEVRRWWCLASMSTPRTHCGACCCNGKLYVVGGNSGNQRLSSGEVYNKVLDEWEPIPSMMFRRAGHALHCIDGKIYAAGGSNNYGRLKTVEVFDPALEGEARKWVRLADMSSERSMMGSAVYKGRLVLIGGRDRLYSYLNNTESYNPQINVWSTETDHTRDVQAEPSLHYRREGLCATVLGWPQVGDDDDDMPMQPSRFAKKEVPVIEPMAGEPGGGAEPKQEQLADEQAKADENKAVAPEPTAKPAPATEPAAAPVDGEGEEDEDDDLDDEEVD